jgi:sodium transport system permease protein
LLLVLLTFAVAPAICEELAFRGFILSGFYRTHRTWLAIGLSSLTFGIMHVIPQQVFNATLFGLVLGLIAIRGNSLWPCMLFHMIHNSLAVVRERLDVSKVTEGPATWFVFVEDGMLRYEWTTLAISAVVAIVLLRWLVNWNVPPASTPTPQTPSANRDPLQVTGA